jgi:crossover junction endodeoxyribonuclease RusA
MVISNKGRAYRQAVAEIVNNVPRIESSLSVEIEACPPDRRRRDLDNLLKACLDALQHGGLYEDDFQICQLTIRRGEVVKDGLLKVSVRQL